MDDIVPPVFNGSHLDSDLAVLLRGGVAANEVDLLNAFMDEVAGSEDACWKLIRRREDHNSPYFNCRAVEFFQEEGYNVYRIRPLRGRLRKFRILYAYDAARNEVHLLAVVLKLDPPPAKRPPNLYRYERNHSISQRVRDEITSEDSEDCQRDAVPSTTGEAFLEVVLPGLGQRHLRTVG